MATIYEVSKLAGVSLATVSRVMNKNARVSEKTQEKVLKAMKQLGYRPNAIAQSLASNRSNSIGVMVPELSGAFYGLLTAGIEAELRAANKHVFITPGHSHIDMEKDGIEFLISRNCDAIIMHSEAVSNEYLIELSKGSTPIYLLSRKVNDISERCISLDNELGGYLATKAIIEQGHKSIAYIAGPLFKSDASERLNGHKRALAEFNLPFHESLLFIGDFSEIGGSEGLKHLLQTNIPFSALVCANDEMASGAMKYAREHGFKLPKDLSLVGFDNVIFTNYLYPKLTTVEYPANQMGKMAAKLVLKEVYNQKNIGDIKYTFEPTLVTRDSIAPYKN